MSDITPIPGTSGAIIYRREHGLNALGLTPVTSAGTHALTHTGAAGAQVGPAILPPLDLAMIINVVPPPTDTHAIDIHVPNDPVADQNQPQPGVLAMIGKAATLVIKIPLLLVAAPIVVCCNCFCGKPFE